MIHAIEILTVGLCGRKNRRIKEREKSKIILTFAVKFYEFRNLNFYIKKQNKNKNGLCSGQS